MMLAVAMVVSAFLIFFGLCFIAEALSKFEKTVRYVLQDEWHVVMVEQMGDEENPDWQKTVSVMAWHEPMGIEPKRPGTTYYDR